MPDPTDRFDRARGTLREALARLDGRRGTEEGHYREIVERSVQCIVLLSPDGTVLELNALALRVMGARREEVIGCEFWETPLWEPGATMGHRIRAAVAAAASGVTVRFEITRHGDTGQTMTLDLSLKPVADEGGRVALIIVEGHDVSDRSRVERALLESEHRFEQIIAIAVDAIIAIDESQRITIFNRGAEHIFGYEAAEVLGHPLHMLLPAELAERHAHEVDAFATAPETARRMGERRSIFGRRKSGEVFPAEASIAKTTVGGRPVFAAVLRDVTERWVADQEKTHLLAETRALHESAERERARSALVAEAGLIVSASLDIEDTLRALAALVVPSLAVYCAIDLGESGSTVHRVHTAHADASLADVAETLRRYPRRIDGPFLSRETLRTGETQLVRELGEDALTAMAQDAEHLVALRALAPRSYITAPLIARGRSLGAISLVRDASMPPFDDSDALLAAALARPAALAVDNAQLYRRARRAVRQREEILGVVSHDLRNPLSAIGMCVPALAREDLAPAERRQVLKTVSESVRWMQRLLADLLDIASLEAGRMSLRPAPLDVAALLALATELHAPAARDVGVELSAGDPAPLPDLRADGERLLQVLSNLIANAIRFTPVGGRIALGAHAEHDAVVFSVADTGRGISAAQLPHVFERFWHDDIAARSRGTGLGLAIVRGIVEAHGGHVWVESTVGEGSTFRFRVPLGDSPDADADPRR